MELTAEQRDLVATVRSMLERQSDPDAVWTTLVEQIGASALVIPEEHDGVGASLVEAGLVFEELGRALLTTPLLASVIAAEAIIATGSEVAAKELLPRIAAGEIVSLAPSPSPGFPATESGVSCGRIRLTAGGTLSGTAMLVPYGDQATLLLVPAITEAGDRLLCVVEDGPGVTAVPTPALDPSLRVATVTLDGARAAVIIDAAETEAALTATRRAELVAVSALQTGTAQRALDMTVEYSKTRVQFGRPIGSFQALKHRMADMLVLVEMSRSASWAAARGEVEPQTAYSYCSDALRKVAAETIQLHGGIAITWEHDAHRIFKRAHSLSTRFA